MQIKKLFRSGAGLILLTWIINAYAINAAEDAKVTNLLNVLACHDELLFIRNGSTYNAAEAKEHLLRKYNYAKDDLNSAEDFIKYCASKSSLSGRDYLVKYPDGTIEKSSDFLYRLLQDFDIKQP